MISHSDKSPPSPASAGEGGPDLTPDPKAALDLLDAAIEDAAPEPPAEIQPPRRARKPRSDAGRPRKRKAEPEPAPPPSPAIIDGYARMASLLCVAGFRISGRIVGGKPETWEMTEEERAEFGAACAPALALHHDSIGQAAPYVAPVAMLYEMWSRRYDEATRDVAEARKATDNPPVEGGAE